MIAQEVIGKERIMGMERTVSNDIEDEGRDRYKL